MLSEQELLRRQKREELMKMGIDPYPAEMLKELELWAQEEFRSTNGQIEYLLSDALRKRRKASKQSPPSTPE